MNVLVQAGGRPFGVCRNVRQGSKGGGGHRGSAGGRVSFETRAKPATGPGFVPCPPKGGRRGAGKPVRACGGHVRFLTFSVRAGSPKPTGAVSPDRDRSNPGGTLVDKPLPRSARCRLSDADIIRRCSGRAQVAPPISDFPLGNARVRPSGLAAHPPAALVARQRLGLSG